MVPINLTCSHCLQHFSFEHLFHLYHLIEISLSLSNSDLINQRMRMISITILIISHYNREFCFTEPKEK